RFPMGASPTRQTLQPEAIGAVMEATKWRKPQVSTATMHWRPNVVQSATNDASGGGGRGGAFEAPCPSLRRNKAALSNGCKSHPANAPAGSKRSSHGGNEMAEASG